MEMRKESVFPGRLSSLKKACTGYWGERALAQADYVVRLSDVRGGRLDAAVAQALDVLDKAVRVDGTVGRSACLAAEHALAPAAVEAKSLEVLCVGHAHTDMNWMWGWNESVDAVLATFRTVLALMDEYPGFTFSQSQASTYRIVEEYEPAMLAEIRRRVREGRWEVTASSWVEPDKNLPSGESLARHLLQTRIYLSGLLGIDPASLDLDFEPDTFGHNANVPEVLSLGGVRFLYHCRGFDRHVLYRWRAPSGAEILAYREPLWYNRAIDADVASYVPEFCAAHGLPTFLKVYGIGDHGGGPTRRDIERLLDMAAWPAFPTVRFGTYREFFCKVQAVSATLPIVEGELNFVFPGCYTSQTRIKTANRISEARMDDAERFGAAAAVTTGHPYPLVAYDDTWRRILFNQFHDILPGSGTIETREHAMGLFQDVLATLDQGTAQALRALQAKIDTASLPAVRSARPEPDGSLRESFSEGAGLGYGFKDFVVPRTERGRGYLRILHFHNPADHDRCEAASATVWDWPGDIRRIEVLDADGRALPFQVEPPEDHRFWEKGTLWDHKYVKLYVKISVPACGFATAVLRERDESSHPLRYDKSRLDRGDVYVLENGRIRAEFDPSTAALRSLTDKASGREMISAGSFAGFRLIDEEEVTRMSSWVVGRYLQVRPLTDNVRLHRVRGGAVRIVLAYEATFGGSKLSVEVSLADGADRLEFDVVCDFRESASVGLSVPQLNFTLPLGYPCRGYRYDIPFGTLDRAALDQDVPASSFGIALPRESENSALMLTAATRYGFRGSDGSLSLDLIRSTCDPDPTPEFGEHRFRFAVGVIAVPEDRRSALRASYDFCHRLVYQPGTVHGGTTPATGSFLALEEGRAVVTAIKPPETDPSGRSVIVRLHETDGRAGEALLRFGQPVLSVVAVDLNERPLASTAAPGPTADGNHVRCPLTPWHVVTLLVAF